MSNPANTRVVVAMMEHETNTFSPVPTPLARFGRGGFGVPEGPEVYTRFKGTGTGIGGLLDAADDAGWDIVTPIAGNAAPSGKVHADAYNYMSDAICSAVEAGCDAVMLDLHGAMVAETTTDGEGTLLARIRSIAPDIPIGISLDLARQHDRCNRGQLHRAGWLQDVPTPGHVRSGRPRWTAVGAHVGG